MILALTVVSLLTFYFSQLYTIGDALSQLAILLGAAIYRWGFFLNKKHSSKVSRQTAMHLR